MASTAGRGPGQIGLAVGAAVAVGAGVALLAMGRTWWCSCGSWAPWSWDVWSLHNSQHLVDPYTFSHVQHGFVFALLLWLFFRERAPDLRFGLAAAIEAAWEIVENTDRVIEHYRTTTASLDYYGDTILNSVADIGACLLGYTIAQKLRWWQTLLLYVVFELGMVVTIRDSLLLNVLMLIAPVDAVRTWQIGAAR